MSSQQYLFDRPCLETDSVMNEYGRHLYSYIAYVLTGDDIKIYPRDKSVFRDLIGDLDAINNGREMVGEYTIPLEGLPVGDVGAGIYGHNLFPMSDEKADELWAKAFSSRNLIAVIGAVEPTFTQDFLLMLPYDFCACIEHLDEPRLLKKPSVLRPAFENSSQREAPASFGQQNILRQIKENQIREDRIREGQIKENQIREGQIKENQIRERQIEEPSTPVSMPKTIMGTITRAGKGVASFINPPKKNTASLKKDRAAAAYRGSSDVADTNFGSDPQFSADWGGFWKGWHRSGLTDEEKAIIAHSIELYAGKRIWREANQVDRLKAAWAHIGETSADDREWYVKCFCRIKRYTSNYFKISPRKSRFDQFDHFWLDLYYDYMIDRYIPKEDPTLRAAFVIYLSVITKAEELTEITPDIYDKAYASFNRLDEALQSKIYVAADTVFNL